MAIGKSSIQKRVAKATEPAAEVKAPKPAPKAEPKAAPAAPKTETVDTAVLANVAPETVERVIGHEEGAPTEHVQIGSKMPSFLL